MARNLGPVEYSEEDTYSSYEATDTPSPGGSTSLEGLTDVDISNPSDGQTLVYNATSGKWENGSGGGSDMFVTLGAITAANVPMTYDEQDAQWIGQIVTEIAEPSNKLYAVRNLSFMIGETPYSIAQVGQGVGTFIEISETEALLITIGAESGEPISLFLGYQTEGAEPVITNLRAEVYAPTPEMAVFLDSAK